VNFADSRVLMRLSLSSFNEESKVKGQTHYEDGKYYAVIVLTNGYEYYSGPFQSRSAAYRFSVKETAKHRWASANNMIYNTRGR
jgi:hypothetical protein